MCGGGVYVCVNVGVECGGVVGVGWVGKCVCGVCGGGVGVCVCFYFCFVAPVWKYFFFVLFYFKYNL